MNRTIWSTLACAATSLFVASAAPAADTIKIAHIDPLSGPFALVGESIDRLLQASIDDVNIPNSMYRAKAGSVVKIETIAPTANSLPTM